MGKLGFFRRRERYSYDKAKKDAEIVMSIKKVADDGNMKYTKDITSEEMFRCIQWIIEHDDTDELKSITGYRNASCLLANQRFDEEIFRNVLLQLDDMMRLKRLHQKKQRSSHFHPGERVFRYGEKSRDTYLYLAYEPDDSLHGSDNIVVLTKNFKIKYLPYEEMGSCGGQIVDISDFIDLHFKREEECNKQYTEYEVKEGGE